MKEIRYSSLGETWLAALREVCQTGQTIDDETRELQNVCVTFEEGEFLEDPILRQFASVEHVQEMRKVFFSTESNQFGHNYGDKMRGPRGRSDLSDVIELLARQPWSKRAIVTLVGEGDGRVPCINAIHFMCREGGLVATYFSRGQDIFRKFYADGICIFEMARRVASSLDIRLIRTSGIISSAHIYLDDLDEIRSMLARCDVRDPGKSTLHEETV